MKTKLFAAATVVGLVSLYGSVACGASVDRGIAFASMDADADLQLAGTWEYQGGDAGAQQKITLTLRSDRSYTKTLEANVNGAPYGGTHTGTWTANGMTVHLSGDGNWPPYTHDLSKFRKVR